MGRKHSTRFITDESQVPDGYVALASFGHNTSIHRALCDAHRDGRVRAVKLVRHEGDVKTGAVWVDAADADEFQRTYGKPQPAPAGRVAPTANNSQIESAVVALCEINNGITLLYGLLERLTVAVENIATQPKTPQQELLNSISGNGFHS